MFKLMILTTIIVIAPFVVSAAIIHVPAEQPTIQAGIDAAVDGDTVLVADGTYTGDGNRDIDFKGKAITVASENGAERCVIDCQGTETENHRGVYFHSAETHDSVLKGFTIEGGYVGGGPTFAAGIDCNRASPIIIACVLTHNVNAGIIVANGAGISCGGSSAIILDCVITQNIITGGAAAGGGMYLSGFSGQVYNCIISENIPEGIHCVGNGLSKIENCLITDNIAYDDLGGIVCRYSDPSILNCIISRNSNSGVSCIESAPAIRNCIIWENSQDDVKCLKNAHPKITYSNLSWNGNGIGNISSDPLFIGGEPFDYHLSSQSPCIDAGTDRGASPTDLDGKQRPRGGGVDMGAYEYQSWPLTVRTYVKMPSHEIFPGDVTSCSVSVWNSEYEAIEESPLFVVLDIMGTYYFAPSYSSFDFFERRFPFGLTKLTILPEFTWPANAGSAYVVWYAFLANHEQTELMSNIGVFDLSWSE